MKKKLPFAAHLNDEEYQLLLQVYADHNRCMGMEKRKKYTLSNIVKVERTIDKDYLMVHFDNGDWWHYCKDGTWY